MTTLRPIRTITEDYDDAMAKTLKEYLTIIEPKRFAKFGATGIINTALDFAVFFILTHVMGINIYASQFISYSIATINSYLINRTWTFRRTGPFAGREFARFFALQALSLSVSLLFLVLFRGYLHMPKILAKGMTCCFTIPFNYLGSRVWVFRTLGNGK